MRNADKVGAGELGVDQFLLLLRAGTGVKLSDEQVFQLLSCLDPKMNGTIPYDVILDAFEESLKVSQPRVRIQTPEKNETQ
ncbi:hypothetical protein Ciccas_000792 [Cichlidogyrus casuarinus]|uniref:Uncharacterized protein n=1 Tax=Cichlidogyrus casuarinus TaxID=1844966 RepID=A0ABD2QLW2_9PLAT